MPCFTFHDPSFDLGRTNTFGGLKGQENQKWPFFINVAGKNLKSMLRIMGKVIECNNAPL